MRKMSVLLAMLVAGWCTCPGRGQDGPAGIIYSRFRHFRIPFQPSSGEQRLKQLQLFVSSDQGKSWQPAALAAPDHKDFKFLTDKDGYFWFAVQSQDMQGQLYPPRMEGVQPSLKVVVDTQPPLVLLQALPPRGEEVGVAWDIRDENLDLTLPDALQAEYRPSGGNSWLPLPRTNAGPQLYWNPMSRSAVDVRVRARDRAGNWGEALTSLSLDGSAASPAAGRDFSQGANQGGVPADRKRVNNKRISLNYDLEDVGPSGVSEIELWFTQDGRSWNKYPSRPDDVPNKKNLVFEVTGEGVYGITLVAKSGVGLSMRPPQLGDQPQQWIEVDMTRPIVQIHNVVVGQGPDKGKLTISWSARDQNLHAKPITLSYAENTAGQWMTIAPNLDNSGQHVWVMPERVPYQFYVRVEAADLAGNVGTAVTSQMIKVDLAQPRVRISGVEPAQK